MLLGFQTKPEVASLGHETNVDDATMCFTRTNTSWLLEKYTPAHFELIQFQIQFRNISDEAALILVIKKLQYFFLIAQNKLWNERSKCLPRKGTAKPHHTDLFASHLVTCFQNWIKVSSKNWTNTGLKLNWCIITSSACASSLCTIDCWQASRTIVSKCSPLCPLPPL